MILTDGEIYFRLGLPQEQWAQRLLADRDFSDVHFVLDAGCGSGRVTRHLLTAAPKATIIAVDRAQSMLQKARELLDTERLRFLRVDLAHLPFSRSFNLIFSNAALHWVSDHALLFRSIFDTLRPGGALLASFGGKGSLERITLHAERVRKGKAFSKYFEKWKPDWTMRSVEETRSHLERAGFSEIRVAEHREEFTFTSREEFGAYLSAMILNSYLPNLPDDGQKGAFVEAFLASFDQSGAPYSLDHVRVVAEARRTRA